LRATGPVFDAFSYHYYGTASHRCTASLGPNVGLDEKGALKASWLQKNVTVEEFYAHLRDQFLPGKQLWLTETGEASCGGDQWASTFLDSFRFMDQLGALAQRNVQTVMVNTLASSDYGLLDDETFDPRPNYWAALIWKRTMGSRVLKPEVPSTDTLRVYAQCTVGSTRGSVSYLLVNLDDAETKMSIPLAGVRNTLTAPALDSKSVLLNGQPLALASDGSVPATPGDKVRSGNQTLPAYSISFFTFPAANNSACR
jgi:hypothetical protein